MDLSARYEICSPSVISEQFDGDVVILNLDDGSYFSLEGAGPSVWTALMTGATPQAIIESARRMRPALAEPTGQFLRRMCEMQLVRPADESGLADAETPVDWTSMTDEDEPRIEVFRDLAELILADPIHDVDAEVGWPLQKGDVSAP